MKLTKGEIRDILSNFNRFFFEEEGTTLQRERALELFTISFQLFLHPVDRAVLSSFILTEYAEDKKRLEIFNGKEEVEKTFDKFINIIYQYYNRKEDTVKRLPFLYLSKDLFEGWKIEGEEGVAELVSLLIGGEDLYLMDPDNEEFELQIEVDGIPYDLSRMDLEELKDFSYEYGIELKGKTREDVLEEVLDFVYTQLGDEENDL